jgi:hypothetical protein
MLLEVQNMKKLFFALMIIFALISSPYFSEAKSLKKPVVLDSDEWIVTLDEARIEEGEQLYKGDSRADVYSLKIANKKGKKHNVTVHTFRKEQGKSYKFGMSLNDTEGRNIEIEDKEVISFKNFPVGKETEEFEVFIMWQEEGSGRFFKQDFLVPVR